MSISIIPFKNFSKNELSLPDKYELHRTFIEPGNDYAISRDSKGIVLSKYGDNIWDLTPYSSTPYQSHTIKFEKDLRNKENIVQSKRLIFLIMTMMGGKTGSGVSVVTVISLSSCLYWLSIYAESFNKTLFEALESKKILRKFIEKNKDVYSRLNKFKSVLSFLNKKSNKITGVKYQEDKKLLDFLNSYMANHLANKKQTPVIPSSIYVASIKERWQQINLIEKNIESICLFIKNIINTKYFAASNKFQGQKYLFIEECIYWEDAQEAYNLTELFDKYSIKNKPDFCSFIRKIQGTCKHLIHVYSGMRQEEVLSLKTDCLEFIDERKRTRIIGITTKLEGTRKRVSWVTSKEIERVIAILIKIATSLSIKLNLDSDENYLFISTSNLKSEVSNPKIVSTPYLADDVLPLSDQAITIKEEDIEELEFIDYQRDWRRDEDFGIGKRWSFATHQYRRSLAVYSIQSGLVSLGALQVQFKHLFRDMSFYYQNGSSSAKDLLNIHSDHIANDINTMRTEIEALSFMKFFLLDDDELISVQGNIIKNSIYEKYGNNKMLILEDRERTIKKFKNGELAWRETMLGGCTQFEPCESRLKRSLIACIGCTSAVHKLKNLESVIKKQKKFVDKLDKNSIEYRNELYDLNKLKEYHNRVKKD